MKALGVEVFFPQHVVHHDAGTGDDVGRPFTVGGGEAGAPLGG